MVLPLINLKTQALHVINSLQIVSHRQGCKPAADMRCIMLLVNNYGCL